MADPESKSKDKSLWVQQVFIECRRQTTLSAHMTVTQSETQFLIRKPSCFLLKFNNCLDRICQVRLEVLASASVTIPPAFWHVSPYSLKNLSGTFLLHRRWSHSSSETVANCQTARLHIPEDSRLQHVWRDKYLLYVHFCVFPVRLR